MNANRLAEEEISAELPLEERPKDKPFTTSQVNSMLWNKYTEKGEYVLLFDVPNVVNAHRVADPKLSVVPMTLRAARAYVKEHHRHAKRIQGGLFAVGARLGDDIVGCAIVGMPVARMLQDGHTVEIRRCCTDGTRNACSFLYRVCVRVANALGYARVLTYTLESESGASLRGAGFEITRRTRAEHWNRESRPREEQPVQYKLRWEAA